MTEDMVKEGLEQSRGKRKGRKRKKPFGRR
jgi:hypothetical protein